MDDRGSQHCSHSIALCSIAGKASLRVIMTTMQTSCMACKHASTLTPCLCSLCAWSCRYLSPEVNQCEGIDLPFVQDKGLFTPKRWTVTVDSATVYAAYAQAYIPLCRTLSALPVCRVLRPPITSTQTATSQHAECPLLSWDMESSTTRKACWQEPQTSPLSTFGVQVATWASVATKVTPE
jgi:hypothetical protein